MSDHLHDLDTLLQRVSLDGRDVALQEPSTKIPVIILSLASDPDNVTVLSRPDSKQNAEALIREMFNLNPRNVMIKRRTSTSDGRTVWANIRTEHWTIVIQDGDELRAFTILDPPPSSGVTKPQWDGIPVTIVYETYVRVLLLSDTFKETKERIFARIKYRLPPDSTSDHIKLRLTFDTPDGETMSAKLHQSRYDSDDDWRALVARLYSDRGSLMIKVYHRNKRPV